MSSPYPCDVEHETLDEELYDIDEAIRHLNRLKKSSAFDDGDAIGSAIENLNSESERLSQERRNNAMTIACREFLYSFGQEYEDWDEAANWDELAEVIQERIEGDSVSKKMELVEGVKEELPRDYTYEYDEDTILDALDEFLDSGDY